MKRFFHPRTLLIVAIAVLNQLHLIAAEDFLDKLQTGSRAKSRLQRWMSPTWWLRARQRRVGEDMLQHLRRGTR